jgi:hypothetical protein
MQVERRRDRQGSRAHGTRPQAFCLPRELLRPCRRGGEIAVAQRARRHLHVRGMKVEHLPVVHDGREFVSQLAQLAEDAGYTMQCGDAQCERADEQLAVGELAGEP